MTTSLRTGKSGSGAVFAAILALVLGLLCSPAPAALVEQIHKHSAGFHDVAALQNPMVEQITSVHRDGSRTNGALEVKLTSGGTAEVDITSLTVLPSGQFTGTANIIVRDADKGGVLETISGLSLRGSVRFLEIWNRNYTQNDASLAGDGQLTRRLIHNLTLIGTGQGAVVVITARVGETRDTRSSAEAPTFTGRMVVVAGRRGAGFADVVITGIRDGEAVYQISDVNFNALVGSIVWRGQGVFNVPFRADPAPMAVQLITQWFNERINRAGNYTIIYRGSYGPNGRYRYTLIQSGRLLARVGTEGEDLLKGDFSSFRTMLRDNSFIGIAPAAITIISSRRPENLVF